MLKGLVLVCGDNFNSNKPLRQVRMMLSGRRVCRGMSGNRISNLGSEVLHNCCKDHLVKNVLICLRLVFIIEKNMCLTIVLIILTLCFI